MSNKFILQLFLAFSVIAANSSLNELDKKILESNHDTDYCLIDDKLREILIFIDDKHKQDLDLKMVELCALAKSENREVNVVAAESVLSLLSDFLVKHEKSIDDSLKADISSYISYIATQLVAINSESADTYRKIKRFKDPIVSPAIVANNVVANNVTVNKTLTINGVSIEKYIDNIVDDSDGNGSSDGNVKVSGLTDSTDYLAKFINADGTELGKSSYKVGANSLSLENDRVILTDIVNKNYALGTGNFTTNSGNNSNYNIALGNYALHSNSGNNNYANIALGNFSLHSNSGDNSHFNIALGNGALAGNAGNNSNNNIALGTGALLSNSGDNSYSNIALGDFALHSNTGNNNNNNIALGSSALRSNTGNNNNNIALGNSALRSNDGDNSYSNIALGDFALQSNVGNNSNQNIALGRSALYFNAGDNSYQNIALGNAALHSNAGLNSNNNIAVGSSALASNVGNQSHDNIALGNFSLHSNTGDNSNNNIALGNRALYSNAGDHSYNNIALGSSALFSNSGFNNIAIGQEALKNLDIISSQSNTMNTNIAIGCQAGNNLRNGDNNIYIASTGPSTHSAENSTIRIGSSAQTTCYIAGISSATVSGNNPVYVDMSTGQLAGTPNSSRRYKDNIKSLDKSFINKLDLLRPVEFNYKAHSKDDVQYGLIAEEVLEDAELKELVIFKDGQPESVKYHNLPILLLARLQQLIKDNKELKKNDEFYRTELLKLRQMVEALRNR